MDEWATRTLLRELADTDAPPTTADIDRAVVTVDRRHRRRTAAAIGALAVAVLAIVLVVGLPLLRPAPVPVTNPPSPTRVPTRFDPTRLNLSIGYRPPGVTRVTTETATDLQRIKLTGGDTWAADAYIFATGKADDVTGKVGASEAGPLIQGSPSRWYRTSATTGVLKWNYAPNARASIEVTGFASMEAVAERFAASARFTPGVAVRVPFTAAVPADQKLVAISAGISSDGHYRALLNFGSDGGPDAANPRLVVMAFNDLTRSGYQAHNTTIGGHPAWVNVPASPKPKLATVVYLTLGGNATAGVWNLGADADHSLLDRAATIRLAASIQLVRDPAHQQNWTSAYLRK